jgi:hypothetical protein
VHFVLVQAIVKKRGAATMIAIIGAVESTGSTTLQTDERNAFPLANILLLLLLLCDAEELVIFTSFDFSRVASLALCLRVADVEEEVVEVIWFLSS